MSKILYPVGTEVQVRDWRTGYHPDLNGNYGPTASGKRVVLEYRKGEDKPYVLTRVGEQRPSPVHFSADEIKSYRPDSERKSEAKAKDTVVEKPQVNCYTKEEVDVLLAEQWKDMLEMLSSVDVLAAKALTTAQTNARNIDKIVFVTNENFREVEKSFKGLSHDDD